MRYREIVESNPDIIDDFIKKLNKKNDLMAPAVMGNPLSSRLDTKGETPKGNDGLKAGPPYPKADMENVKAMQTKLERLGYSVGNTGIDGKYGPRTTRAVRAYKKDNKINTDATSLTSSEFAKLLTAKKVKNPSPVFVSSGRGKSSGAREIPVITSDQKLSFPGNAKMEKMANKARQRWQGKPNSEMWVAALMAQIAHETAQMSISTERGKDSYFDRYDGRKDLGNVKPGDGRRYRGRGWIQLTGRYNYQQAGKALGIDLENNPEMAADPDLAMDIAIWYFEDRVMSSVSDPRNIKKITYKVNGGYNGFKDRKEYFNTYASRLIAASDTGTRIA